ncbi:MAG: putative oxidoreductase [Pirellulaceae bacterium]
MESNVPNITQPLLEEFAINLLAAGGATQEEAEIVGRSLVSANLRGYESHGVMRIPFYLRTLKSGDIVSGAELEILNQSDTRVVADAHWGFGRVQAGRMMEMLIERAKTNGIGVGSILKSGHIGRLGEYCEWAAKEQLISMLMVNSHGAVHRVAPSSGRASRLGTNPIAIGTPHRDEPLVADFSTSATAEGKVRVKHIAGEQCPPGWLIDSEGNPTTNPGDLYADPPGAILPMGGDQAYKGFGLALMVEILTGALSGGLCSRAAAESPNGNCVFMLLLNPAEFGGADRFRTEVEDLVDFVRSCPTAPGHDRIILPGDPERVVMASRLENGCPFDDENWGQLTSLAAELGVEPPTGC